jgi:charged multivesicular body protein 2A
MLSFLFAPKQTPKELLQECRKSIRTAVRDIERAQEDLEEKKQVKEQELKIYAKKGEVQTARVLAKDLVRMRNSIAKFHAMTAELKSVEVNLLTMQSTEAMSGAMRSAALSMQRMNSAQSLPALQNIIKTFGKEQEQLNRKQDMMNDAMDDVFEQDQAEEDELVNRVLDEVGIHLAEQLPAPAGGGGGGVGIGNSNLPADMRERLDKLKK